MLLLGASGAGGGTRGGGGGRRGGSIWSISLWWCSVRAPWLSCFCLQMAFNKLLLMLTACWLTLCTSRRFCSHGGSQAGSLHYNVFACVIVDVCLSGHACACVLNLRKLWKRGKFVFKTYLVSWEFYFEGDIMPHVCMWKHLHESAYVLVCVWEWCVHVQKQQIGGRLQGLLLGYKVNTLSL